MASLVAIGVTVWRSGATEVPDSPAAQRQRAFAHWETINTEPLAQISPQKIELAMLSAEWTRAPLSGTQRTSLIQHVSEFLEHRYGQTDPAYYRAWRLQNGYRLIDRNRFVAYYKFSTDWNAVFGEPLSDSISIEQIFDAFWPIGTSYFGDVDIPVAVGTDPRSWSIAFGRMNVLKPQIRPPIENSVHSNDQWIGIGGGTMRSWFEPPFELAELAAADKTVATAEVGLLIEYKNGERRPLGLTLVYDNTRDRWWLIYAAQYNIPENGLVAALEF